MSDTENLERFVAAQNAGGTYERALAELHRGRKTSHWMWFVFPQIAGLGSSPTSVRYAISSMTGAKAYLAHPVLGTRLRECANALLGTETTDAEAVLGAIDARKLQSSMTLFHRAEPGEPIFTAVLDRFFGGVEDDATIDRL